MNAVTSKSSNVVDDGAAVINELHVRMPLCRGYTIDLLSIFNNLTMDAEFFFAQLFTATDYPAAKLYRGAATEANMRWIISWLRSGDREGGKLDVADDTAFTKLLVKVKDPAEDRLANTVYATIELFPDATIYYRLYARTSSGVTTKYFPTCIVQLNRLIERIAAWNIFLLPTDLEATEPAARTLARFTPQSFLAHVVYMNLIVPDYWGSLAGASPANPTASPETLAALHRALVANNARLLRQETFLVAPTMVQNHVLGIFLHRRERVASFAMEYVQSILRLLRRARVGASAWRTLLAREQPLALLAEWYPDIFREVDTEIARRTYQAQLLADDVVVQTLLNLFGTTVNIMVNNVTLLGVTSVAAARVMEGSLGRILRDYRDGRLLEGAGQEITAAAPGTAKVKNTRDSRDGYDYDYAPGDFFDFVNADGPSTGLFDLNALGLGLDVGGADSGDGGGTKGSSGAADLSGLGLDLDAALAADAADADVVGDLDVEALLEAVDQEPDIPVALPPEPAFATDLQLPGLRREPFEVRPDFVDAPEAAVVSLDDLRALKNQLFAYEQERMDSETSDRQAALAHLKEFIPRITGNRRYAQECQSDKKPLFLTIDEYAAYRSAVRAARDSGYPLTPFGGYLETVIDQAIEWGDNMDSGLTRFICCMAYDFYTRQVLNPYCLFMDMGDGTQLRAVYYIHFATADRLVADGPWVPHGDVPEGRYDPRLVVVAADGSRWYPDPAVPGSYAPMTRVYPGVARFHCVDFNSSKNYTELPYKFFPNIVQATGMPCCFSKHQDSPISAANYNGALTAAHNMYKAPIRSLGDPLTTDMFDEVNRIIELPETLNILFNNTTESVKGTVPADTFVRRVVFNGSFVSLFDFLLLAADRGRRARGDYVAHSRNPRMITTHRPSRTLYQVLEEFLGRYPGVYNLLRNGLIRQIYPTPADFLAHVYRDYWTLDEDELWDCVSSIFDINLFVIEQTAGDADGNGAGYRFRYPEGFDTTQLFRHRDAVFAYRYTNKRGETMYDLIDHIGDRHRRNANSLVNFDVFDAVMHGNPADGTPAPFVREVIDTLRSTELATTSTKRPAPTAYELVTRLGSAASLVAQHVTAPPLRFTDAVTLDVTVGGGSAVSRLTVPVAPFSYLPGVPEEGTSAAVLQTKAEVDTVIATLNALAGEDLYTPTGYLRRDVAGGGREVLVGYQFANGVHWYFADLERGAIDPTADGGVAGSPDYRLITLFFEPGKRDVYGGGDSDDPDTDLAMHSLMKANAQSLVVSFESMLVRHKSPELQALLSDRNAPLDRARVWKAVRDIAASFFVRFVGGDSGGDDTVTTDLQTTRTGVLPELGVRFAGILNDVADVAQARYSHAANPVIDCSAITTSAADCNAHNVCFWSNGGCRACGGAATLAMVMQLAVDEIMNPFGTLRWRIVYDVVVGGRAATITNGAPEQQIVVNVSNSERAIHEIELHIKARAAQLADNVRMVTLLTSNFTDMQRRVVHRRLQNLNNRINRRNLHTLRLVDSGSPDAPGVPAFVVHFDPLDFWYTAMVFSDHDFVTLREFREGLGRAGRLSGYALDDYVARAYPLAADAAYLAAAPWNTHSVALVAALWEPPAPGEGDVPSFSTYTLRVFDSHPDDPNVFAVLVAWPYDGTAGAAGPLIKMLISSSRNPLFNRELLVAHASTVETVSKTELEDIIVAAAAQATA